MTMARSPARKIRRALRALTCIGVFTMTLSTASEPPRAAEPATPTGQVVLTIAGNISTSNRPAFDEFEDGFLKFHDKSFARAMAFDLAMLEALGMRTVTIDIDAWPKPARFEGPRLADLLAAAGATGKDVTLFALDGFGSELSAADVAAFDWIVGVKRDGRYLDIGQRGPLWVVYKRRDGKRLTDEDEQRWPWATFYIEVK